MIIEVAIMAKHNYMPTCCKDICKCLTNASPRYSTWEIYEDWLMMSAIAISNSVDWQQADEREKEYLRIAKKYDKNELDNMASALGMLITQLDEAYEREGLTDILGQVFHALELHNKYHGQFFTPFHICELMGQMTLGDNISNVDDAIKSQGYISCLEPCIGSGGLVIGLAEAMRKNKYNHQKQLVITGVDIDIKCVCMSYIQLSLLGIPAVIVHGNSLTVEQWSVWRTPMYMIGGWEHKIKHSKDSYLTTPKEQDKKVSKPATYELKLPEKKNGQFSLF